MSTEQKPKFRALTIVRTGDENKPEYLEIEVVEAKELTRAQELLNVAKTALEFYAHGWDETMIKESWRGGARPFGERAREALAKINAEVKG